MKDKKRVIEKPVKPEIPPKPIPDSKVSSTLEADVLIIGAGIAGLSAARSAAETGASVIVIEKAKTYQYRSGKFGIINSKIQKSLGIKIDKDAVIQESLKQMGYRADQRMWEYWADNSGAAFDWMLELAPDAEFVPEDATSYDKNKIIVTAPYFPPPPGYNPLVENSPAYPTVINFIPDQGKMLDRVYKRCLEKGCRFLFSTWACQLIRKDDKGRVQGAICKDIKGEYMKVIAGKGVILATGDYANNRDMVVYYAPWAIDFAVVWPNRDASGKPTNTGDGQKMGMWVGAKMEDGPHALITHSIGGPLGVDAFFLANLEGNRFVNEDISGQQLSNALSRQSGNSGWQIFDDKWPEQIGAMGCSLFCVNYCTTPDKKPKTADKLGRSAFITREEVHKSKTVKIADNLRELVGSLGLDATAQTTLLKSIERYNELCKKGVDEDFGKTAKRLFPIATPPFYAAKIAIGFILGSLGGLRCDPKTGNVLDKNHTGIKGLYAAGNTMGGRFLGDYPVVAAGATHGFALTYGRLVGMTVAKL